MATKYFNFNNEQNLIPIDENEETGEITITIDGDTVTFKDIDDFATNYALSRNVLSENLKNWTLLNDNGQYSFVLRAGTAGLSDEEQAFFKAAKALGFKDDEIARVMAERAGEDDEPDDWDIANDAANQVLDRLNDDEKEMMCFLFNVDGEDELFDELVDYIINKNLLDDADEALGDCDIEITEYVADKVIDHLVHFEEWLVGDIAKGKTTDAVAIYRMLRGQTVKEPEDLHNRINAAHLSGRNGRVYVPVYNFEDKPANVESFALPIAMPRLSTIGNVAVTNDNMHKYQFVESNGHFYILGDHDFGDVLTALRNIDIVKF